MTEARAADEWDFYPCRVDDAPASILINLRYLYQDPRDENDHVFHVLIPMQHPGPQGIGSSEEMERLTPIEDALCDRAELAGAEPVGRLRSQGVWQVSVYGPASLPWAEWVKELVGEDADVLRQADGEFQYLNEFLLPDEERHQWIQDRRVCDLLAEQGDDPTIPRPVDHFIQYEHAAPPALVAALEADGFDVTDNGEGLECSKVHHVELEHVHEIVMRLIALADEHGAGYDGWGCTVKTQAGPAN